MITAMILTSAFNWQANIAAVIRNNPNFSGKTVKVCMENHCVLVDKSNSYEYRECFSEEIKGVVEKRDCAAVKGNVPLKVFADNDPDVVVSENFINKLDQLGNTKKDTVLEFKETLPDQDGKERPASVRVEVKKPTRKQK